MKIVLEQMKDTTNLNILNEMIKKFDNENMEEFYKIYNAYKQVYGGLK